MNLSTQLHRGTLALPMLLLFAILALLANEEVDDTHQAPAPHAVALAHSVDANACNLPRAGLLLAQAPADLPRSGTSCRA
jgi:hypothetical protein